MQAIDPQRWDRSKLLARMLLMVGPHNEDLTKKYLEILIDHGLPPTRHPQNVVVVGAGAAGLVSSWLLARAGHRVTVIEANDSRVGGRIKTFRHFKDPQQYAEAGAMRLPDFHPMVLALVDSLGLQRRLFYNVDVDPNTGNPSAPVPPVVYEPFDGSGIWHYGKPSDFKPPEKLFRTWIRTNGQQMRRTEYAFDPREINGGFQVPEAFRGKTANDVINTALDPVRDYYSFVDPKTRSRVRKPFPEWLEGWARVIYDFDQLSMWGYLKEVGGLSDEVIESIGTLENLTSRLPLSFFHSFLGRSDINPAATYWEIVGGTDRLTDALKARAEEAGVSFVMGQRMIRLEYCDAGRDMSLCEHAREGGPQVWIETVSEQDGKPMPPFEADRAIVTIPFSSLRHVLVQPLLSYKKRRAIIELHYDSATKVLLEFNRRWWEFTEKDWQRELDAIHPGLYEQYCEENCETPPGEHPHKRSRASLPDFERNLSARMLELYEAYRPLRPKPGVPDHFFGGGSVTDNPNRFIYYPSHPVPGSPGGVILASYTWADDAARWDSMDDDERYAYALRGLVAVHGERILQLFSGRGVTQSWMRNPYAFGEAAVFTPWQLTQFHLEIPTVEGPVHFAGEHTSLKHAWIEGALESAVRAAVEVNEVL